MPAALIGLPGLSPELNTRYAAVFGGSHYRYIDNRPDESPYRDISQLPPASLLRLHDGSVRIERYWDLSEQDEWHGKEQDLAIEYRELLLDLVRRRMDATSAHAFTLSGGLDSSSVTAAASPPPAPSSTPFPRSIGTKPMMRAKTSGHF